LLDYIALYPNPHAEEFNDSFIFGKEDTPITDFIITSMREFEAIENIKIESVTIVSNPDEVDINEHSININYKKKGLNNLDIPKVKMITKNCFGEVVFKIRVSTNLNEKIIIKKILYPLEIGNNLYLNNNKKMKAIYQLVDASVYSQRGRITLKSKMPIILYKNNRKTLTDLSGVAHEASSFSYALESKKKKRGGGNTQGAKNKVKYINPLMIYCAKMGYKKTAEFFGMDKIINLMVDIETTTEILEKYYVFKMDELFVRVRKDLFDRYEYVRSFVYMTVDLRLTDFPVTFEMLEDKEYWLCRIGYIGSTKNKNLSSFREKGSTTVYMIERLLDTVTINVLRLPDIYKSNVYFLLFWMMTNYDEIKKRSNLDMYNKRVRRNEYIVTASLGKKINENINKLIERKSKSKMNTLDTLLELFNFNSDIIIANMRNLNDLIKSDDLTNDFNFLVDLNYSVKGPNSLGETSSKLISNKYRYLHPSMLGIIDINQSSQSDVGLSGSFVPFVDIYDKYFFNPDPEPCNAKYEFDKAMSEKEGIVISKKTKTFQDYLDDLKKKKFFEEDLKYMPIEIVEKVD
jgi:hypothetical protein